MQPCSGLQRKRMKRRRQIGGGEEYSGSAKDNADEALSVGILLWRIRASEALKDLASSEEFAEVEACEGTALVGPDDVWFECTEETKPKAASWAMKASRQRVAVAASSWARCDGQMRPKPDPASTATQ